MTTEQPAAAAAAVPRKPGRPKGSRTRRPAGAAGPMMRDPGESAPLAAVLAAASPPPPNPKGGRPRAADVKDADLTRLTTTAYRRLAAMLGLAAVPAGLVIGAGPAARLAAVAAQLDASAEDCATALVEWSRSSERVRRMLASIGQGSGATAVLIAHAPILLAVIRPPAATTTEADAADGAAAVLQMAAALFGPADDAPAA